MRDRPPRKDRGRPRAGTGRPDRAVPRSCPAGTGTGCRARRRPGWPHGTPVPPSAEGRAARGGRADAPRPPRRAAPTRGTGIVRLRGRAPPGSTPAPRSRSAALVDEEDGGEGGQREGEGVGTAVHRNLNGVDAAHVAPPASPVDGRIAVEHFPPEAAAGSAHPVVRARHRGEVTGREDDSIRRLALPDQAQDAGLGVIAVNPLEARRVAVKLVERGRAPVEAVELGHPSLEPRVGGGLQQIPLEAAVGGPLAPLPELAPPEEELLRR